jgi:hypothetical protein
MSDRHDVALDGCWYGGPFGPRTPNGIRTRATAVKEQTRRHRMTMETTESAGQRPFGQLVVDECLRPFLILLLPQRCPDSACAPTLTPVSLAGAA